MTSNAQRLLVDALQLSDDDRAELAGHLIESLDSDFDADASAAWDSEIRLRIEDIDRRNVLPIQWAEARCEIHGAGDDPNAR